MSRQRMRLVEVTQDDVCVMGHTYNIGDRIIVSDEALDDYADVLDTIDPLDLLRADRSMDGMYMYD